MTTTRDGGPAFPDSELSCGPRPGMSLRDWFAGQALAGALIGEDRYAADKVHQSFEVNRFSWLSRHARDAYAIADAMLKERERVDGEHDAS